MDGKSKTTAREQALRDLPSNQFMAASREQKIKVLGQFYGMPEQVVREIFSAYASGTNLAETFLRRTARYAGGGS